MKRFTYTFVSLFAVVVFCLIVAEVLLRIFTPFPVHGKKANKVYDVNFGYRLARKNRGVDSNGFRNIGIGRREVAAIGDSHTYGSGVELEQSWPAVFERKTGKSTYNFGVGNYAIYTYYAIARHAIDQGYKDIIIALSTHSDYTGRGTSCAIDYDASPVWKEAKLALSLNLPTCRIEDTWKTADAPWFIRQMRGKVNSAILSAFDVIIAKPFADWRHRRSVETGKRKTENAEPEVLSSEIVVPETNDAGTKRPASWYLNGIWIKNLREDLPLTDLAVPETRRIYDDFKKLILDLRNKARDKGIGLGFLFLPSKLKVAYEYTDDKDIFEEVPWLTKMALNQIAIDKDLTRFMDENDIAWRSAMGELKAALARTEKSGGYVYRSFGGHPGPEGYKAYAEAAEKLYEQMTKDR